MPQIQLPMFPAGVTEITKDLSFEKRDGRVTYFHGLLPVFFHDEADIQTFRMITSQFCVQGVTTQSQIVRAFGVPVRTVKRHCKLYREKGPQGFYAPRVSRGPAVLVPEVMQQAQRLLDQDLSARQVAEQLGVKPDTMQKAVRAGRLHVRKDASPEQSTEQVTATTKSERSAQDAAAPMGMGATNTLERVMASVGKLRSASIKFQTTVDVPNAGVLLALPALLANGLLEHVGKYFQLPPGYYGIDSVFLLLGFMALCRIKQVEQLRYCAPGEWGKLLGLDRIPEVRTLRNKLSVLSGNGQVQAWGAQLCTHWMAEQSAEMAGVFYIDGHVRVYHGSQTKLPRHHVARQRLCLRATTDYWVNAMDGQPFFLVTQAVDPGLIRVLEEQILPRLKRDATNQPTAQQLEDNPLLHRFIVVFDREGYSPELMARLKAVRVACLTYRKKATDLWPQEEFIEQPVRLVGDNWVTMKLAERGVRLSNGLWVRELRKLCDNGHQTSIVTTDYYSNVACLAAWMFARWCQENFFRYMREHYNLDRLVDYETQPLSDTTRVVNPAFRRLESQVRTTASLLSRKLTAFGALNLEADIEPPAVERFQQKKAELYEQVTSLAQELARIKAEKKQVPRHITAAQLPADERFSRLSTDTKHFVDTIKMIAYRAETAMAQILHETMSRSCDARSQLRDIYTQEADLIPDHKNGTLTVRLHHMANSSADEAVRYLCEELNSTTTTFPGTKLRLVYELVPSQSPRDQDL